ncbi:S-adenosylmethionine:tRNA ribosyltransferase-isomerase [Dysgonomonas sp. PH5-45]|uniref:S-adenosylmethionine:tRNA ribosyltransferase-isomerase n=1 Tax=unclassified Dysgonomonas TaxID=2630389 RepID=UPI0024769584|nr:MULTISPECIES: S-adenosylmethionine:tRNA ribosyltransferase-isomerase [unclassified Dysgonomonas]MDH6355551.1 S-adenosylmethionine:tRNA ribosyltransferase-isomerase [Dysgonomonas sp. PH5-45]MDH6388448.1 S-adenosylmethionine:tRNA ribosyltransferase-isomerase [Dysgonomonas sp. PH5-37]
MKNTDPKNIRINEFDYNLPDERIAKYPLNERDSSKLLVYNGGQITDSRFASLADFLPANSLMVFNNTKVIQARLFFRKETGAQIEIFCLDPYQPHDYVLNFQQTHRCSWLCLVGNLKKWKEGTLHKTIETGGETITIKAYRKESLGDSHIIEFEWNNPQYTFSDLLEIAGELPIPPYLNRKTEEKDKETYQTLYSKVRGSVAAPTAGLHFTEKTFASLAKKGIEQTEVTLHVGAGTFKPVKTEIISNHEMHTEFISVHKSTIEKLLHHQGKVVAVGTTSVRTLESLYYIGALLETDMDARLEVKQWQPYSTPAKDNEISKQKALNNILNYLEQHNVDSLLADTQIMIVPGYQYKIVDAIVTNFHQPKSTLLLLVSAFIGDGWKEMYLHALAGNYRFLSYGDSSLLLKS